MLIDQQRVDQNLVLTRTARDIQQDALRQRVMTIQRAANVGGAAEGDGVVAAVAAVHIDLGRHQAAVDVHRRGLAIAGRAAVIAVHAQVHALAGLDQTACLQAATARNRQVVARQQAQHAHGADHRVRRQDDIARGAGLRAFVARHQPRVGRVDLANVERQRLRHALRIGGGAHLHQRHVANRLDIDGRLRAHRRHDQRVVDRRARRVGLHIAAHRTTRHKEQAAARHDRNAARVRQARMRGLVADDVGGAAQVDLIA